MDSNQTAKSWQQPDKIQGLIFDGATFLTNFVLLSFIGSTSLETMDDAKIGLFLGIGVLAQLAGALLKRVPLQNRLFYKESKFSEQRNNFLGCLTFIHFIFFLIVVAMTLTLVGFVSLDESEGWREFFWFTASFAIAATISGIVWVSIHNPGKKTPPEVKWRFQEIGANILLWISTSILTRYFWTTLLFESEPPTYMGFSMRAFVLIAAVSALFMVFYVPSRLLFLAEDYKYPVTWLRLWLVAMLPLLTVVLF